MSDAAGGPREDIVVVSPSSLLAQTVRAALISSGRASTTLSWSTHADRQLALSALSLRTSGMLLVVLDPPTPGATRAARELVGRADLRTVVVVGGDAEGLEWGAMLEAGAELVLAADSTLVELLESLDDVAAARARAGEQTRLRLVEAWRESRAREEALMEAVRRLDAREGQLLRMLREGVSVQDMALRTGLSGPEVHRGIGSTMRHLGVDSVLAAIAVFDRFLRESEKEE